METLDPLGADLCVLDFPKFKRGRICKGSATFGCKTDKHKRAATSTPRGIEFPVTPARASTAPARVHAFNYDTGKEFDGRVSNISVPTRPTTGESTRPSTVPTAQSRLADVSIP